VELTGCLSELAHHTLKRDFRHIDPGSARIVLVEGGERVLPSYPLKLSAKAAAALTRLGIEIQTGAIVTGVEPNAVTIRRGSRTEYVRTRTILWAAGVQASPLGRLLAEKTGAAVDKEGRIVVQPDLTVPGHPELFVLGDLAHFDHQGGKPLPGVAPVAMQQGRYAAKLIESRLRSKSLPPFHYKDRGSLAVIGRNAAVADLGWLRLSGFPASRQHHCFARVGGRQPRLPRIPSLPTITAETRAPPKVGLSGRSGQMLCTHMEELLSSG